jgi:hypothetical protein
MTQIACIHEIRKATGFKNGFFWDVTLALFLVHRSCRSDEGGAKFLRNVGSYKSYAA